MTAYYLMLGGLAALFVAAPLAGMAFLKKRGGRWTDFFTGAGIFFLFVLVLESTLHNFVLTATPLGAVLQGNIWLYGLYGGLAAGIFEETGRFVAFRFLLKQHRSRITALGYGIGHGGCEAVLLLSLTYLSNIALLVSANSGAALAPEAQSAVSQILSLSPAFFLWGGLERVIAIALHMALSVLVFAAVAQPGRRGLFPVAILLHAAVDFTAVVCSAFCPVAVIELVAVVFTAAIGGLAVKIYSQIT